MSVVSKLPAPAAPPPAQPSGTVTLYKDAGWVGSPYSVNTRDYLKDTRHSIAGSSLHDEATWIAFNLPVGTVMTLTDNYVAPANGNVYDLINCGRVVDLVGTGQTEAVDLTKINLNDCISAFFWHTPDLSAGAIELYESAAFAGNRTVLFLSEWGAGKTYALDGWYIKDRASSVRWPALVDAQMASLFNNNDGSGAAYGNIKAWGSFSEVSNLKEVGFNDAVSSFSWNNLLPKQSFVKPVDIVVPDSVGKRVSDSLHWPNDSSAVQKQTLSVDVTDEQTTTVTATNQYTAGMQLSYSLSAKKTQGTNEVTKEWTLSVGFVYSHTDESSLTKTQKTTLVVTVELNVPPYCIFDATLWVQLGQLPPGTTYKTTAERWYDQELKGSVYDPANGYWKRTESVTLQMGGTLAVSQTCETKESALPEKPPVTAP
ncbi:MULTISPECIES: hypothetical protein [unclassified Myxococcus]|uniref:hypothetical protein n=1 Tax=unclassified Myxococcus TaxID=2648731 RepID=UPI00157B42E0|nr:MULTISPECIES: hypothetical protein [unclassified Myxococcus]NTX02446.1 hypothetical protein [Myxococcus sp. CA040A]NTX39560.1 hypothetical protein [Myxococcus sp. CA033]NTX54892.1 hypothetical protein [Myxococcus sp. CA039A]